MLLFPKQKKQYKDIAEQYHKTWQTYQRTAQQEVEVAIELTENHPLYAKAWNTLGLIMLHRNQFSESEKAFLRAHELEPSNHKNIVNLGSVYFQSNQCDKAIVWWQKALAIRSDLEYPQKGIAFIRNNLDQDCRPK